MRNSQISWITEYMEEKLYLFSAIDADIENVKYHLSRCSVLEEIGEKKSAIIGFKRMLRGEISMT